MPPVTPADSFKHAFEVKKNSSLSRLGSTVTMSDLGMDVLNTAWLMLNTSLTQFALTYSPFKTVWPSVVLHVLAAVLRRRWLVGEGKIGQDACLSHAGNGISIEIA